MKYFPWQIHVEQVTVIMTGVKAVVLETHGEDMATAHPTPQTRLDPVTSQGLEFSVSS